MFLYFLSSPSSALLLSPLRPRSSYGDRLAQLRRQSEQTKRRLAAAKEEREKKVTRTRENDTDATRYGDGAMALWKLPVALSLASCTPAHLLRIRVALVCFVVFFFLCAWVCSSLSVPSWPRPLMPRRPQLPWRMTLLRPRPRIPLQMPTTIPSWTGAARVEACSEAPSLFSLSIR